MTFVAVVGGTALIAAVVAGVLYLPVRRSVRRSRAETDAIVARMREDMNTTPPLPLYEPLPFPDGDPPEVELRVTIHSPPGSDADELPKFAARLIRETSRLERSLGGWGLRYDEAGSEEEPTKLVLRLVPELPSWGDPARLEEVAAELRRLMREAQEAANRSRPNDLRHKIERELRPTLPPCAVREVEVAVLVREAVPLRAPGAEPVLVS